MKIDILDYVAIMMVMLYLVTAIYTKVEESFNLHAVHDILRYGMLSKEVIQQKFDHIDFPGAVPRTFIGAAVLAKLTDFFVRIMKPSSLFEMQLLSRGLLGFINILALIYMRSSILTLNESDYEIEYNAQLKALGEAQFIGSETYEDPLDEKLSAVQKREVVLRNEGRLRVIKNNLQTEFSELIRVQNHTYYWFAVIMFSQFHIMYYASRTLPNFFALPLTTYAFAHLINRKKAYSFPIALLAFTGIIFRAEVGLLALIVAASLLAAKKIHQSEFFFSLVNGFTFGASASLLVDGHFWNKQGLIPEVQSFIFNVWQGNSANWGTEPWSAYLDTYIPKLIFNPAAMSCIPAGVIVDCTGKNENRLRILAFVSAVFIGIMSLQGHKEWRFIIYIIPVLSLLAANGAALFSTRWKKGLGARIATTLLIFCSVITLCASIGRGIISSYNYPGGQALDSFHSMVAYPEIDDAPITVHMDVTTCMTGASLFGQEWESTGKVIYDKTEDEEELYELFPTFDYVILANASDLDKYDSSANWYQLGKPVRSLKDTTMRAIENAIPEILDTPVAHAIRYYKGIRGISNGEDNQFTQEIKDLWYNTILLEDSIAIYKRI